jgi:hypothetical protein
LLLLDTPDEGTHSVQAGAELRSDVLADFVQGKRRILFNFSHHGKQEDRLGELARKWGYKSGAGNFNASVNELVAEGRLKRFEKGGKMYLKITWRGEAAIMPLILPKLLILFVMVVSLALISETVPALVGTAALPPDLILEIGLVLLVFSVLGLFLVHRMEAFLLEPQ